MTLVGMCRTVLAAALFAGSSLALPALAVTNAGDTTFAPYVAAFTPTFGSAVPYVGTMKLLLHDGTIAGTYTGISARPDRLNNRIEPVTGSVNQNDGYVQFNVGSALSFNGTMAADGTIAGTATYNGRLYDFMAKPGIPGQH